MVDQDYYPTTVNGGGCDLAKGTSWAQLDASFAPL